MFPTTTSNTQTSGNITSNVITTATATATAPIATATASNTTSSVARVRQTDLLRPPLRLSEGKFDYNPCQESFKNILEENNLTGKALYTLIHQWLQAGKPGENREIKDITPERLTDNIRPAFEKLFRYIGELMFSRSSNKNSQQSLYHAIIEPLSEGANKTPTVGASAFMSEDMYRLLADRTVQSMTSEVLEAKQKNYMEALENHFKKNDQLYFCMPGTKNTSKTNIAHVISSMKAAAEQITDWKFEGLESSLEKLSSVLGELFNQINKNRGDTFAVSGIKKDINSVLATLKECHSNIFNLLSSRYFYDRSIDVQYIKFFSLQSKLNLEDGFTLEIPRLVSIGKTQLFELMVKEGCPKSVINKIDILDKQLEIRYG